MTEHTPGPWVAHPHSYKQDWIIIAEPDDPFAGGHVGNVFNEADARLIARAPAMEEALRAIEAYCVVRAEQNAELSMVRDKARAALTDAAAEEPSA